MTGLCALAFAAALVAAFFVVPAVARSVCGDRAHLVDQLHRRFKETPAALGMIDDGRVLELLTSAVGSWTILVTAPNGTTCLVASGEAWEEIPRSAEGDRS